jgi:hypothetical protein
MLLTELRMLGLPLLILLSVEKSPFHVGNNSGIILFVIMIGYVCYIQYLLTVPSSYLATSWAAFQ